jgi:hypothetical protein
MTEERKQEIRNMPWSKMEVVFEPQGDNGLEGYSLGSWNYGFKLFVNDEGKEKYLVTNGLDSTGKEMGDVDVIGRNLFRRYFRPIKETTKMEENKNNSNIGQAERMKQLVKSFDEKSVVIRESETVKTDDAKVLEEANRFKTIARIDEFTSNTQFAGTANFNPGYGQTVNTFMPTAVSNQKYNPNYTYLQPAEALGVAVKRAMESGAPVKDMGFYEEVNWNLNNMGFDSKNPIDIKGALMKLLKDNI